MSDTPNTGADKPPAPADKPAPDANRPDLTKSSGAEGGKPSSPEAANQGQAGSPGESHGAQARPDVTEKPSAASAPAASPHEAGSSTGTSSQSDGKTDSISTPADRKPTEKKEAGVLGTVSELKQGMVNMAKKAYQAVGAAFTPHYQANGRLVHTAHTDVTKLETTPNSKAGESQGAQARPDVTARPSAASAPAASPHEAGSSTGTSSQSDGKTDSISTPADRKPAEKKELGVLGTGWELRNDMLDMANKAYQTVVERPSAAGAPAASPGEAASSTKAADSPQASSDPAATSMQAGPSGTDSPGRASQSDSTAAEVKPTNEKELNLLDTLAESNKEFQKMGESAFEPVVTIIGMLVKAAEKASDKLRGIDHPDEHYATKEEADKILQAIVTVALMTSPLKLPRVGGGGAGPALVTAEGIAVQAAAEVAPVAVPAEIKAAGVALSTRGGGEKSEKKGSDELKAAAKLGFDRRIPPQRAPFDSHGQQVFSDGRRYITRDVDGHKGGVWKMFDRHGNRMGTYDSTLNRVGK